MRLRSPALALALALALPTVIGVSGSSSFAAAEVVDAAENGFTVKNAVVVPGEPARAYAALLDVGKWWDSAHTYSGDAANLSIEGRAGGCFCERVPADGSVRHMTVVAALPGKMLRLRGSLGPLQALGVESAMTWTLEPGERGTRVELLYAAGGYNPGGARTLAAPVDSVLRAQLERYKRFVETGKP